MSQFDYIRGHERIADAPRPVAHLTNRSNQSNRVLKLDLVVAAEIETFYPSRRLDRAMQRMPPRPLRCSFPEGSVFAHPAALPFADASFDAVECLDQLELIRRDEELLAEIARVLRVGGKLTLRVPSTGPLAGFDSYNLSRYLVDVSHHGVRPHEPNEIGWRKHYSEADLRAMAANAGLSVVSVCRSRFIISELLELGAQTRYRWWSDNPDAYRLAHRTLDRIRRIEDRLRFPAGYLITIEAVRPNGA